jgi:DNA-binding MarR family transcriptional regulator
MKDSFGRQKDQELDGVIDKLFQFAPFFYRNIFSTSNRKFRFSPGNVQVRALTMLTECRMLRTSDMGRRLGISRPNVTSLVDKLIEQGHAERLPDTKDRRVINLCVTDKGRRFISSRRRAIRAAMKESMSVLKLQDMEELSAALEVCRNIISKVAEPPL